MNCVPITKLVIYIILVVLVVLVIVGNILLYVIDKKRRYLISNTYKDIDPNDILIIDGQVYKRLFSYREFKREVKDLESKDM